MKVNLSSSRYKGMINQFKINVNSYSRFHKSTYFNMPLSGGKILLGKVGEHIRKKVVCFLKTFCSNQVLKQRNNHSFKMLRLKQYQRTLINKSSIKIKQLIPWQSTYIRVQLHQPTLNQLCQNSTHKIHSYG